MNKPNFAQAFLDVAVNVLVVAVILIVIVGVLSVILQDSPKYLYGKVVSKEHVIYSKNSMGVNDNWNLYVQSDDGVRMVKTSRAVFFNTSEGARVQLACYDILSLNIEILCEIR